MSEKTSNPDLITKAKSYKVVISFHGAYFSFFRKGIIFKGHKIPEKIHFPVDMRHFIQ